MTSQTPTSFDQARFNMIEQQIRPWDVLDLNVLALLAMVRREDFVPAAYQALAHHTDDHLEAVNAFLDKRLPSYQDR